MEEVNNKIVRTKKVSESSGVHKIMTVLVANTIREIVKIANEEEIKREDIVSLLKENAQFILIYYK